MTESNINRFGVLVCVLLAMVTFSLVYSDFVRLGNIPDNACVIVIPKQLTTGMIMPPDGLFGGGQTMYLLAYEGERKETGEYCEQSFYVTERKYESAMYGYKNE